MIILRNFGPPPDTPRDLLPLLAWTKLSVILDHLVHLGLLAVLLDELAETIHESSQEISNDVAVPKLRQEV